MRNTTILLKNFIFEKVLQCVSQATSELVGEKLEVQPVSDPLVKDIALSIRIIGDELDGRADVQRLKGRIIQVTKETFMKIAFEVFADGIYNWGRVVILFLLASAVVLKAIADNSLDTIKDIVGWTLEFIKTHLLDWIRRQGGWEACLSYFQRSPWKKAMVLVGFALVAIFIFRKWRASGSTVDK